MYSEEQYYKALKVYEETRSVTKTITILGYPARRQTLYNWINRKRILPEGKSTFRGYNTEDHPRHPPLEQKLQILHRCFEMGENVQSVSNEVGYSTASIYAWRRKYLQKGAAALMNSSNERRRGKLTAGEPAPSRELDELKAKVQDMQLEIDILKQTIDVLKKDPGINKTPLSNGEKVVIVDALKTKYPLPVLLKKLKMAKSSYYYQKKRLCFAEKHKDDCQIITTIFHNNKERYGYRRIKAVLNREGYILSEKVIRRIMRENRLLVKGRSARKYCSYKGEISPEVPNVIQRNFRADKPNQKWLTDVTEFSIPAGKVYLSPIIDCYDCKNRHPSPICTRFEHHFHALKPHLHRRSFSDTLPENQRHLIALKRHPLWHMQKLCQLSQPAELRSTFFRNRNAVLCQDVLQLSNPLALSLEFFLSCVKVFHRLTLHLVVAGPFQF